MCLTHCSCGSICGVTPLTAAEVLLIDVRGVVLLHRGVHTLAQTLYRLFERDVLVYLLQITIYLFCFSAIDVFRPPALEVPHALVLVQHAIGVALVLGHDGVGVNRRDDGVAHRVLRIVFGAASEAGQQ